MEGVGGVEDVKSKEVKEGEECKESAQDMEAQENQQKKQLAEMVLQLNITEFYNIHACTQQLPILPYGYILYSNTKVDG